MTNTPSEQLLALADDLTDTANSLLRRADRAWSWRRRDRNVSIAIGDTSRALRGIASALRAHASGEQG